MTSQEGGFTLIYQFIEFIYELTIKKRKLVGTYAT